MDCRNCGLPFTPKKPWQRYCSPRCKSSFAFKGRYKPTKRTCRWCGASFTVRARSDANRQYCTPEHSAAAIAANLRGWREANPERVAAYKERVKGTDYWKQDAQRRKLQIIALFGGKCRVCPVNDPLHLELDLIQGNRAHGFRHRHPKHLAYVKAHRELFQLLCANHHREKTTLGFIRGDAK